MTAQLPENRADALDVIDRLEKLSALLGDNEDPNARLALQILSTLPPGQDVAAVIDGMRDLLGFLFPEASTRDAPRLRIVPGGHQARKCPSRG